MKSYGGKDENINNWRWIWIGWCNIRNNLDELNILEFNELKLNSDTCQMSCNENSITINGKEMELLQLLIVNKNQVLNRELQCNDGITTFKVTII